jgi:hypothetical protein
MLSSSPRHFVSNFARLVGWFLKQTVYMNYFGGPTAIPYFLQLKHVSSSYFKLMQKNYDINDLIKLAIAEGAKDCAVCSSELYFFFF